MVLKGVMNGRNDVVILQPGKVVFQPCYRRVDIVRAENETK